MIRLAPTMPLSAAVPRRLAAKMPLVIPTDRKITDAPSAMDNVAGNLDIR